MKRETDAKHSEQQELTEEQLAELEKRLAELDENPEPGKSWDMVRARILEII